MSETITIKGVSTIRWGTDSVAVITGFLDQGVTLAREPGIKKRVKDEKGFIVSKVFGDDAYKVNIKAVYNGGTPPATGAEITVIRDEGGTTVSNALFVVEKVSWTYGNESELLMDIEAEATTQITS